MRRTKAIKNVESLALYFLADIYWRAEGYAERLDPKRKRNYERSSLLHSLDAIASRARSELMRSEAGQACLKQHDRASG